MSEQPEAKPAAPEVEPPSTEAADPAPAKEPETSAEADAPASSAEAVEDTSAEAEAAEQPKPSVQPSEEEDDTPLDAAGRERPRFLLSFPSDPELARLAAAFEAGNYALVRAEAEGLAERTQSPAVRAAALELRRRIGPDPLAKYLLALTAALLLFLTWFAYGH